MADDGTLVISVDASVVRGKHFSFPPMISAAAPTFFVPAIVYIFGLQVYFM
jgi:hypothetical protein